ncbi:MAG: VCBS repeat-containing protein [Chitinophagales bacterium]|nr:VCBS repeat-containing protein [Chitinophagales bacterium]
MKKLFSQIVVLIICINITNLSKINAQYIAEEMPHETQVTAGGAFTYTLPIRIPPGINEMVPSIAITYNSQSGNDILGMGWGLTGLSSISRNSRNLYYEREVAPLDFTSNDGLYLDGQKLYEISTGEYLTHVKNFAKINSYGTSGNGPQYFVVEYPNGLVYKYGETSNSRMLASNSTTSDVLTWNLNEISDKKGNIITFTYHNNQSTGDYRIKDISYATNTNVSGHNPVVIEFGYTSRNDKNKVWVNGSFVRTDYLLDNITIKHPDASTANKYEFSYSYDMFAHLTKIEEFREGNQSYALPPIDINWGTSTTGVSSAATFNTHTSKFYTVGDFNGDGASDYVITPLYQQPSGNTWQLYLSDKNNNFDYTSTGPLNAPTGNYQPVTWTSLYDIRNTQDLVMDYNGDGYDDLVTFNKDVNTFFSQFSLDLYLSNGATNPGFGLASNLSNGSSNNTLYSQYVSVLPGDFDGDKKTDMLLFLPTPFTGSSPITYTVLIIGEEYNGFNTVGIVAGNPKQMFAGDLNGDGKTELWRVIDNTATPAFEIYDIDISYDPNTRKPSLANQLGSNMTQIYFDNSFPNQKSTVYPGDFNGDGKTDMLTWTSAAVNGNVGVWSLKYSTGIGFDGGTPPSVLTNNLSTGGSFYHAYYVSDYNGDGLDDIIQGISIPPNLGAHLDIFYSKGDNEFDYDTAYVTWAYTTSTQQANHKIGDYNGDGQSELLYASSATGSVTPTLMLFDPQYDHHMVTSIEHAGKTYDIEYTLITQDQDYDISATSSYPKITRTLPIKVVTRLSDNFTLDNTYKYKGLIQDRHRRTMLGFTYFDSKNIDGQNILSEEYDYFTNTLPYLKVKSILNDPNQPLSSGKSGIETIYSVTEYNGGANGNSIIVSTEERTLNTIEGVHTYKSITPGNTSAGSIFYDFGQPESIQTQYSATDIAAANVFTATYTYDANAPFVSRSKPISVTKTDIINGASSYVRTTEHTYDSQTGFLTSTTYDPSTSNEHTNTFTYDVWGHMQSKTVSASGLPTITTITNGYTNDGRYLAATTNALGYKILYKYDASLDKSWGNLTDKIDEKDFQTLYEYDKVNRLVKTTYKNSGISSSVPDVIENISYDWASNHPTDDPTWGNTRFCTINSTNNVLGNIISYYDHYNRLVRNTSPSFGGSNTIYKDTKYLDNGLVEYTTSPYPSNNVSLAHKTEYEYDYWNRETRRVNSGSTIVIETTHDIINGTTGIYYEKTVNNVTNSQVKKYQYSNGLLYQVDDNGNDIYYDYYSNGSLNTIDANAFVTNHQYDNYGRLTYLKEPNSAAQEYEYDAYGRVTSHTLTNGTEYGYTYDNLGRVLTKSQVNSSNVYTYDYENTLSIGATGELKWKTLNNVSTISYYYDNFGRLINLHDKLDLTHIYNTYYTYDEFDRLVTTTYPTGDVIKNNYNGYGNLLSVELINTSNPGFSAQKLWQVNQRNHLGQLTEAEYYNSSNTAIYKAHRTYTDIGLPFYRKVEHLSSTNMIVNNQYGFNTVNGNLISRADNITGNTEQFTYDNFDRLTNVTYNVGSNPTLPDLNMKYGDEGNILQKDDITNNNTQDWKYDEYAVRKIPDPDQNTPAWVIPQNQQDLLYTPFNKVQSISEANANLVYFTYGPEDSRKSVNYQDISAGGGSTTNEITKYYSNNFEHIDAHVSGDQRDLCYIWAGDELIGIIEHQLPSGSSLTGNIYYMHTDYLGSITHILDNTGTGGSTTNGMIEQRSFDAWGRPRDPNTYTPIVSTTPPGWMFDRGYTGHEHIWLNTATAQYDNNIINMNGRLYDPVIGRMFSPDPVLANNTNSQDFNRYAYAKNNPLKYTDPDGNVAGAILVGYIAVAGILNVGVNAGRINSLGGAVKYFGIGAGSALVSYGVGSAFGLIAANASLSYIGTEVARATVHGGLGIARASIDGSDLTTGFIFGFVGSGTSSVYGYIGGEFSKKAVGSILFSTVSGGFTSMAMGSNFWTGAFYSSIPTVFNHVMHTYDTEDGDDKKKNEPDDDESSIIELSVVAFNAHYQDGSGTAVTVYASEVDLSHIFIEDFDYVDQIKSFQTLFSSKHGRIFGRIDLKYLGGNRVKIQSDNYGFEMHDWNKEFLRNIITIFATPGPGKSFAINFYGEGHISTNKRLVPSIVNSK